MCKYLSYYAFIWVQESVWGKSCVVLYGGTFLQKQVSSVTIILTVVHWFLYVSFCKTHHKMKRTKWNKPYPVEKVASTLDSSRSLKFFLKRKKYISHIYSCKWIHRERPFMYMLEVFFQYYYTVLTLKACFMCIYPCQ